MKNNQSINVNIKTWFVTGASSGIGYKMCESLLEKGYNVIAVARGVPMFDHPNALCLRCDVTERDSIVNAVNAGIQKFGRIDVLMNNAGITASILCEDETLEHMKEVMEVNFFGTFNTINILLPHFRENKNGTIINNTSQSGISYRAYGSAYCASKHAVEGLTSVVRQEAQNFCRVMAFELGFFKGTEIVKACVTKQNTHAEYGNIKLYGAALDYKSFENRLDGVISSIISAVEKEKLPRHLPLGYDSIVKAKHELEILRQDIENAKQYNKVCIKFIKQSSTYWKIYLKYLKYRFFKNIVWGDMRLRYKRKAKELHAKIRAARRARKTA